MFVLVGRVITVYCFTFGATVFSIQWNYFIITLLMLVDCDVVLIVTFFFMFLKLRKICLRLNFLFLVFSFFLHFLVLLFFMQLFSFTHISVHRSLKSRCMSLGQNQQATPFQQVRQRSGTTVRMRVNWAAETLFLLQRRPGSVLSSCSCSRQNQEGVGC